MKWRAYYPEAVYDSSQRTWARLPAEGLQVVVVFRAGGRRDIYAGGDWYWLDDGEFRYISSVSWDSYTEPPVVSCLSCLKKGTACDQFPTILEAARNDHDIPTN